MPSASERKHMQSQSLPKSEGLPEKWQKKYYVHVIGMESPILISEETKNNITEIMSRGMKFISLGEFTIMINSIKMIAPRYEPDNIPPMPTEQYKSYLNEETQIYIQELSNGEEIKLWKKMYGEQKKNLLIGGGYEEE